MVDLKIGDICIFLRNTSYFYKIINITKDYYFVNIVGLDDRTYNVEKKHNSLIPASILAKLLYL